MRLTVDLHSHSGYSGGVGQLSLAAVAETMGKKGIAVFGTGDCLQADWREQLQSSLSEREAGLFALNGAAEAAADARFLLQTEIIITAAIESGARKSVHTVLLVPSFACAEAVAKFLAIWDTKLGIGRPFLKCADPADVSEKLEALQRIDESLQIIPAHVLTPSGIYGADAPVNRLADFYGPWADQLTVVETGLSADPPLLALIPELDERALISNSDCHSAALNRVGREYTALSVDQLSYDSILSALRNRRVEYTAEFTPAEGRYFLTGHRSGKKGHGADAFCYFSPDRSPPDGLCPICGKPLTVGVLERAMHLSKAQGDPREADSVAPRQKSIRMVPLTEVIAAGLGVKNAQSKKVLAAFERIIAAVGTEASLWEREPAIIERDLGDAVSPHILQALLDVRNDRFCFDPLGFDGQYGELKLGETRDWFGHAVVKRNESA